MLGALAPKLTPALAGLVFLDGLLAFVSPCILPMLPVYLLYLCGSEPRGGRRMILNTLGFVAGFTTVFVVLGATASGLGKLAGAHRQLLTHVGGAVMILLGLNFLEVIRLPFFGRIASLDARKEDLRFASSYAFGAAFSLGWTPCLGAFLGSALLMASSSATLAEGVFLLVLFSLGLGLPFLVTAVLWDRLQGAMGFLRRHMVKIRMFSGILLILTGLLMLFDRFDDYMRLFS